jgi:hypothetical protein
MKDTTYELVRFGLLESCRIFASRMGGTSAPAGLSSRRFSPRPTHPMPRQSYALYPILLDNGSRRTWTPLTAWCGLPSLTWLATAPSGMAGTSGRKWPTSGPGILLRPCMPSTYRHRRSLHAPFYLLLRGRMCPAIRPRPRQSQRRSFPRIRFRTPKPEPSVKT